MKQIAHNPFENQEIEQVLHDCLQKLNLHGNTLALALSSLDEESQAMARSTLENWAEKSILLESALTMPPHLSREESINLCQGLVIETLTMCEYFQ